MDLHPEKCKFRKIKITKMQFRLNKRVEMY